MNHGNRVVAARALAVSGAAIGCATWMFTMVSTNPGEQWFWEHDDIRTMLDSLETLFRIGVFAITAHTVVLLLTLQLTSQRGGFWAAQAVLLAAPCYAGLDAVGSVSSAPVIWPIVVPVTVDIVVVALIGLAWRITAAPASKKGEAATTGLGTTAALTAIVPLIISQFLTGFWLDVVFDEGMGTDTAEIVRIAIAASVVAVIYAQIMVAASKRSQTLAARDSAAAA